MPSVLIVADAGSIHTRRWAGAIAERGWTVHLLSLHEPGGPLHPAVVLHRAPVRAPLGYLANARFLARVAAAVHPDLVHAHYVTGYGTLAVLAGVRPLLLSAWGADVYDFPARSPLHAWLVRRNLRRADAVLSTSHAMAGQVRRLVGGEVGVTPFGIDLERFRPMEVAPPFEPGDLVVGTVKTLAPKYGIEHLVRAFALLRDRLPDLPLKLLLVGDGPQRAELEALARDLGLAGRVRFAGFVPHERVPEHQNMLSISVSVSTLDSESFGVAVLEASACARPVVVSSVGGLPEVVEDGVTGLVVPPRDPVATADALERLARDPALRESMGRAGRERVARLYAWELCVDRMIEQYRAVLRPRAPAR